MSNKRRPRHENQPAKNKLDQIQEMTDLAMRGMQELEIRQAKLYQMAAAKLGPNNVPNKAMPNLMAIRLEALGKFLIEKGIISEDEGLDLELQVCTAVLGSIAEVGQMVETWEKQVQEANPAAGLVAPEKKLIIPGR